MLAFVSLHGGPTKIVRANFTIASQLQCEAFSIAARIISGKERNPIKLA